MKKHLVLAGCGHAHLMTLTRLHRFIEKDHKVSVIGPSAHHYYSGMGPGMLAGTYTPEEIRFAVQNMVERRGGRFIKDHIIRIDANAGRVHLGSGDILAYDVLSCNLGSHVAGHLVQEDPADVFPVKPIERLEAARVRILEKGAEKKLIVGIIGSGPSAVEIAGNVHRLAGMVGVHPLRIKVFCDKTLLPRFPDTVRRKVFSSFQKRGIQILQGEKITEIRAGVLIGLSEKPQAFDLAFVATGVRPSRIFNDSGIPCGPDGGMRVNRYLQSTAYGNIFGAGDCIWFQEAPLDKAGVYAVRQNPVLYHNLMAALSETPLQPFIPQRNYLSIFNLGDGTGLFYKRPFCFSGRMAFTIKNHIDRKFMRKFHNTEKT